MPPHPAVLLLAGDIRPKSLTDPDIPPFVLPSPLPAASAWAAVASDVDAHSVFVYTAADLIAPPPPASLDPAIILAYTKPSRVIPRHRILIFVNQTSTLVPEADLPKRFAASNAARAHLGLPPFILDGPPPSAP
jgi:hypothetical protein